MQFNKILKALEGTVMSFPICMDVIYGKAFINIMERHGMETASQSGIGMQLRYVYQKNLPQLKTPTILCPFLDPQQLASTEVQ
ncbi:hypothetical protein FRX31_018802 [Thalictrum thalictroides]|uniref:Uncharacterized protein n=1 Tax=Thalictrum thalictroides TaxID=46969 RepID=A0A7J6W3F0_THATH|nr:hypothetical protein FRX31_018802 [Thalictrum thalictroides]